MPVGAGLGAGSGLGCEVAGAEVEREPRSPRTTWTPPYAAAAAARTTAADAPIRFPVPEGRSDTPGS
jgi:hypothetical protein